MQKAFLAAINRSAKKQIIQNFLKKHKHLHHQLSSAYKDMLNCFQQSQECLKGQRFSVVYDEYSWQIQEQQTGTTEKKQKLKRISYFQDFIFIQQLMILEIDIILG